MDATWQNDGLLFGTLSENDCARGGRWTVGDLAPPDDPGHSRIIKYKSWVARAGKYGGGTYLFKDRRDSGLWEYVMTLRGVLNALEKTSHSGTVVLPLHPGRVAEFPPEALRSWELPPDCNEARGCTLLWSGVGMHTSEGLGGFLYGFCFESWTPLTVEYRLHRPFAQHGLSVQYVEVFTGSLQFTAALGERILNAGDHVYVHADVPVRFVPSDPKTYGTVLYY